MKSVTIGVLALQGDVREHVQALRGEAVQVCTIRRPKELLDVDAVVLPGGESTTIDKLLRIFELQEPLRARIRAGMPVYGSCAGMILLADRITDGRPDQESIGGMNITVRRNAFGRQVDSFEEDLHFAGIQDADTDPVRAVFIRAPWVEQVGDGVEVLATVQSGPAAGHAVAVRQGNLLATAFHPEVTGDTRVHRYFADIVKAAGR